MSRILPIITVLCVALCLASCDDYKGKKGLELQGFEPELSTVSLALSLPLTEIQSKINSALPKVLLTQENLPGKYSMNVIRNGNVQLQGQGQKLAWKVPILVELKNRKKKNLDNLSFELMLEMDSKAEMNRNWTLDSETKLQKHVWIKQPKLDLGLFKLNLAGLVEKQLYKHEDELTEKIDQLIHEKVHLDKAIGKVWEKLWKPIRLSKEFPELLMYHEPQTLFAGKAFFKRTSLVIPLKIKSFLGIEWERETAPVPTALPKLKALKKEDYSFEINLICKLPFEQLNRIVEAQLGDKVLEHPDYGKVTVDSIHLYGSEQDICFQLGVNGDFEALLELCGKIEFESDSVAFQISSHELNVIEGDVLVQAANFVMHDYLLEFIKENSRFTVKDQLEGLPVLIHDGIEDSKSGDKLEVEFVFDQISMKQYQADSKDFELDIKANGAVEMKLEQL